MTRLTRRQFMEAAAAAAATPLMARAASAAGPASRSVATPKRVRDEMSDDLVEITVPRLHALYDDHKYTATQVTRWYLDRIARYDRVYRAILHVDAAGALATAAALDAAERGMKGRTARPPLWGVPIVIKANTSVKGLVTSAGWYGYLVPGHELIAPVDATVVGKLKAAGAIILGQSNMPDFAASDTNFSTAFGRTGNAYNVRFSPGGSSGGTVTAVAANYCVLGTGTDTGNSIRMPASTSSVVGMLPTRGLVSIAGIHPLDWLLDNTGPIARDVTDAAIALDVMAGEDPKDFRTKGSQSEAQARPYTKFLNVSALKGTRFGVPAFIVQGGGDAANAGGDGSLQPETREMFKQAIEGLRAAGATVVSDDAILPSAFQALVHAVDTRAYAAEGLEDFLRDYGPSDYHSSAEYARAVGGQLPGYIRGASSSGPAPALRRIESDPQADARVWGPRRTALTSYDDTLARFQLDGFVYPAAQMPPNDEMIPLQQGGRSDGPHSQTAWVNPLGVPAISIPGGFYASGLPFGIELSTRRWRDGDLLGWAFAYEQATKHRRPPVLVERRPPPPP